MSQTNSPILIKFFIMIMFAALLGGCIFSKAPKIESSIVANTNINPAIDGSPSPVVVSIYYLKNVERFRKADFFELYKDSKSTLGNDLVEVKRRQIKPGQTIPLEETLPANVSAIGVICAFRDIEQAQWREIISIPKKGMLGAKKLKDLAITINQLSIVATVKK